LKNLAISCFYTHVLQCLKLLAQEKNTKVYAKQFASDPTTFKVEENSRTFHGLTQKFKDVSRKNKFKNFSRTPHEIQGLFKTVRTLSNVLS